MQLALLSLFALSACLDGAKAAALHPPTKPAVVMVPGAFHVPQVFEKVIRRLRQDDYKFLDAVALPSVGHLVGRQADTNAVTKALCQFAENRLLRTCADLLATDKHLNAGRDVVLVGNSKCQSDLFCCATQIDFTAFRSRVARGHGMDPMTDVLQATVRLSLERQSRVLLTILQDQKIMLLLNLTVVAVSSVLSTYPASSRIYQRLNIPKPSWIFTGNLQSSTSTTITAQ